MSDLYVPRIVDGLLDKLLCSFPVISLVGPRAAGKTITAVRRGGAELPQAVAADADATRRRWFAGYVEQIITRDVPAVAPRRDPELLRRYLYVFDYEPRVQRAIADDAMRRFEPNVTCSPGSGRQGIPLVRAVLEGCPP